MALRTYLGSIIVVELFARFIFLPSDESESTIDRISSSFPGDFCVGTMVERIEKWEEYLKIIIFGE